MTSLSYLMFPSKEEATRVTNGENWWSSDGKALIFESKQQGNANTSGTMTNYPLSGQVGFNGRLHSWLEFKLNLDTFTEGTIFFGSGCTELRSVVSGYVYYGVSITPAFFRALDKTSGYVTVSVQANGNGLLNQNSSKVSDNYTVFVNGHRIENHIGVGINFGSTWITSFCYIHAPEGVEIASVVRRLESEFNVIRSWWYIKNLELETQVGGQDVINITSEQANGGYTHNESTHVEMSTNFSPREGSIYPAAFVKAYARHVRKSVQFGRAGVRTDIGGRVTRKFDAHYYEEDELPEVRIPLSLLDVGVETYTNVGGVLHDPTVEELKKIGLIVDLDHENYVGV